MNKLNPFLALPAEVDAQALERLGIYYGTQSFGKVPHIVMSAKDWRRAIKAAAVKVLGFNEHYYKVA